MPQELRLATRTRGLAAIVQVGGTLDLHGADEFDREIDRLLHGDVREILIDLSEVGFMDSIALRSLVRAHQISLRAGVPLWLVGVASPVARVMRMTGLDAVLPLVDELPRRLRDRSAGAMRPVAVAQPDMRINSGNR
jgi:anti-sigma B factor antagonist